jgi:hypothetical protein
MWTYKIKQIHIVKTYNSHSYKSYERLMWSINLQQSLLQELRETNVIYLSCLVLACDIIPDFYFLILFYIFNLSFYLLIFQYRFTKVMS